LIFCRIAPVIAIAEIKGAAHLKKPDSHQRHSDTEKAA
jgi:hypothetical protein